MTAPFDRKSMTAILIDAQRGAMKRPPSVPGGLRKLNAISGHSIRRSAAEGGNGFHKSAHGAEVIPLSRRVDSGLCGESYATVLETILGRAFDRR
jgi:hypothetical protein